MEILGGVTVGITTDRKLNFYKYISALCKKASLQLSAFSYITYVLSQKKTIKPHIIDNVISY